MTNATDRKLKDISSMARSLNGDQPLPQNINERLEDINKRSASLSGLGTQSTDNQLSKKNLVARGIPSKGAWAVATFDMGSASLTVRRYVNGKEVGSPTILNSQHVPRNERLPGAFTGIDKRPEGGIDYRNESQLSRVQNNGAIPLGEYDIRMLSVRTEGAKNYRKNYADYVTRDWMVLDARDKKPGNDINDAYGRDGLRLHLGSTSLGCVTVPIANAAKWREIEDKIPKSNNPGQVVGSMQVIDSRPEVGNNINPRAGGFER
jgi:Protein of unknown function (DUF2778)